MVITDVFSCLDPKEGIFFLLIDNKNYTTGFLGPELASSLFDTATLTPKLVKSALLPTKVY